MKNKLIALSLAAALSVTACQQQPGYGYNNNGVGGTGFNKQQVGTVLGGVGGGIIGSNVGKGKGKTAATIGGALLGGLLGNSVGQSLDAADQQYAAQTAQGAFENSRVGTSSTWVNPDSGNRGTITPTRTYQSNNGQYCREFSQSIVVGGQRQNGFGTACRQPDGSWQIIN